MGKPRKRTFGDIIAVLLIFSAVVSLAERFVFTKSSRRGVGVVQAEERGTARSISGRVTRVSDGDTVWVSDSLGRHKVRLNRIDAPESDQPFGKESAAHLKSLIGGRDVRVEYTGTDQYGRILGIIFLGDTDINLQMVKDGCAWHYSHFDKTPAYAAAEREARTAKRGLWAADNPINPHQWRKSKRGR